MTQLDNYLPIEYGLLAQIIPLLNIKSGEKFCDLGSGDGRVVIAAAQTGAEAVGIEIDSTLVQESRQNILNANITASIVEGNMFDVDLSSYDIIYTYLCHDSMRILFDNYKQNPKPGSRMLLWCGYGTNDAIIARACSNCSYLMDMQNITGGVMHKIASDITDSIYYMLIVVTPQLEGNLP